jgi:fluoroquinolone transport system permease protein
MKNIIRLLNGEIKRLLKYKILFVSLFVSVIWVLIIAFSEKEEILGFIPVMIGADAGMMSIIYLAASFYLEKQEGTLKSLFVLPVRGEMVLIAKIIASALMALLSALFVVITMIFVHKYEINIALLFIYILIIVFNHTAIGYLITLNCRDFGQMIGMYAAYAIVLYLPTILFSLGIIPEKYNPLLMLSPSHSAQVLLNSVFFEAETWEILIAIPYQLLLGGFLYTTYVNKKFKAFAIEG